MKSVRPNSVTHENNGNKSGQLLGIMDRRTEFPTLGPSVSVMGILISPSVDLVSVGILSS